VFPTKQAKSQRRQWQRNQNFIRWQNAWKKTLGETRLSQGASSPQGNERTVYDYDSGSISGQKSDWIRTFRIFIQFHLVEDRSHPVSMETVLRISAKKIKFSVIHIEINMKFCETWIFVDCSDLSHTCPGCCRTFLFFLFQWLCHTRLTEILNYIDGYRLCLFQQERLGFTGLLCQRARSCDRQYRRIVLGGCSLIVCPDLPVFSTQAKLSGFSGYMETPPVAMLLHKVKNWEIERGFYSVYLNTGAFRRLFWGCERFALLLFMV